jgi:hypothetical protein
LLFLSFLPSFFRMIFRRFDIVANNVYSSYLFVCLSVCITVTATWQISMKLDKSVAYENMSRIQMWLKPGKNIFAFTWRSKYVLVLSAASYLYNCALYEWYGVMLLR